MKLQIDYTLETTAPIYLASTEVYGKYICAHSDDSFKGAKERLLEKVKAFLHAEPVPASEEVSI